MFRFYHTIMDMEAFRAQEELSGCQGDNGIWLVGGYTVGVGLQEECWIGAIDTVEVMLGKCGTFMSKYRFTAKGKDRVPAYIRRLVFGSGD